MLSSSAMRVARVLLCLFQGFLEFVWMKMGMRRGLGMSGPCRISATQ